MTAWQRIPADISARRDWLAVLTGDFCKLPRHILKNSEMYPVDFSTKGLAEMTGDFFRLPGHILKNAGMFLGWL